MRVTIAVILIVGLSALLFFVGMNSSERVAVNLAPMRPVEEYPVSLVVLVSLAIGVLFASIIGIVEGTRLRLQNHALRSKLKKVEAELKSLQNVPLSGGGSEGAVDEESAL